MFIIPDCKESKGSPSSHPRKRLRHMQHDHSVAVADQFVYQQYCATKDNIIFKGCNVFVNVLVLTVLYFRCSVCCNPKAAKPKRCPAGERKNLQRDHTSLTHEVYSSKICGELLIASSSHSQRHPALCSTIIASASFINSSTSRIV